MTPMGKAEAALNGRIAEFQAKLRNAEAEATRRSLVHAVMVLLAIREAVSHYVQAIGDYAKNRFAELKEQQTALTGEHAQLLKSGSEMLERLKANPADREIRKEIERTQRSMEAVQKNLRRGADTFQREIGPSLVLVDKLADSLRRLCESEDQVSLKRATKTLFSDVEEFSRVPVDAAAWYRSAAASIDEGTDFYDANARACFQALLALELITLAISTRPEAQQNIVETANAAATARVTAVASRLANSQRGQGGPAI
jgi:hypothetical protein